MSMTLPRLLAFALLLVSLPAVAGKVLVAQARGQLVVDVDGSVAEVTLKKSFGAAVDEFVESRIRQMRFEPIVEDGRPVQAVAHMMFDLKAVFDADGRVSTFGITDIGFIDPPGHRRGRSRAGTNTPPRYPTNALRAQLGARVHLRLLIDADGTVLQAAPERGILLVKAPRITRPERWLQLFTDSASKAVLSWTFEPSEDGRPRQVVVPMSYTIQDPNPWNRAHMVAVEPQPWMLETDSTALVTYGPGGELPDLRLKLLTPLDPIEDSEG